MTDQTFEAWLLTPGNHRILLQVKKQIESILNASVQITSWRSLYDYFEAILGLDNKYAQVFTPIFFSTPPSIDKGASDTQMQLYEHIHSS